MKRPLKRILWVLGVIMVSGLLTVGWLAWNNYQLWGKPLTDIEPGRYALRAIVRESGGFRLLVQGDFGIGWSGIGKQVGWEDGETRYVYLSAENGWVPGGSFRPLPIIVTSVSVSVEGEKYTLPSVLEKWNVGVPRYDLYQNYYWLEITKEKEQKIFDIVEQ